MTSESIHAALLIAFEAGKWEGQVELEEYYDKEQYAHAMLEVVFAQKNAMPLFQASNRRIVAVQLRSDSWRDGVRKSTQKYLETAEAILTHQGVAEW